MKQTIRDAFDQMTPVANFYINKRECSIQEFMYHILPGQWLNQTFLGVMFTCLVIYHIGIIRKP